ncbi:hypothetical protein POVCU2_0072500 [Plasmodium ovale curtisi]|uniref:Uncharacterized protein n=1 Tax=Plasmodium ovale curtisi TaxID=864141 RepID=A0A1A8WLK0_PLAOA|nr:hypothetical protein POVCU2_0072500 [Plasmodium ovale curtisi]
MECKGMIVEDIYKYQGTFKYLMEGWKRKNDIDINSTNHENKADKSPEITNKNFLNLHDDTFENHIDYIRENFILEDNAADLPTV